MRTPPSSKGTVVHCSILEFIVVSVVKAVQMQLFGRITAVITVNYKLVYSTSFWTVHTKMVNRCYYLESNIEKELQKYFEKRINYPISLINGLLLISMKHTKLVLLEDAEVFRRIHNRCQLTPDFRLNLPL